MKKITLTLLALTILSCSTNEKETKVENTKLERDIKDCVEQYNIYKKNSIVPPPGLNICDCIDQSIKNNETNNQ